MKPSRASTPIACAQPASASVSKPKPASRQAPAARASSPGVAADSSAPIAGAGAGVAGASPVVETAAQHEPEQQRERGEQDQRAGEHGDDHHHERVVRRGGLRTVRPRSSTGFCASAQPAITAATASAAL